jgi:hypothetical protein
MGHIGKKNALGLVGGICCINGFLEFILDLDRLRDILKSAKRPDRFSFIIEFKLSPVFKMSDFPIRFYNPGMVNIAALCLPALFSYRHGVIIIIRMEP